MVESDRAVSAAVPIFKAPDKSAKDKESIPS